MLVTTILTSADDLQPASSNLDVIGIDGSGSGSGDDTDDDDLPDDDEDRLYPEGITLELSIIAAFLSPGKKKLENRSFENL